LLESKKANASLKVIDFGTSRKLIPNKKMSKRLGTVNSKIKLQIFNTKKNFKI